MTFNMFRIWDRINLKTSLDSDRDRRWDVRGGSGTVVKDYFDNTQSGFLPEYPMSEYVSIRMDDGRIYDFVHASWLKLRSPTTWNKP